MNENLNLVELVLLKYKVLRSVLFYELTNELLEIHSRTGTLQMPAIPRMCGRKQEHCHGNKCERYTCPTPTFLSHCTIMTPESTKHLETINTRRNKSLKLTSLFTTHSQQFNS